MNSKHSSIKHESFQHNLRMQLYIFGNILDEWSVFNGDDLNVYSKIYTLFEWIAFMRKTKLFIVCYLSPTQRCKYPAQTLALHIRVEKHIFAVDGFSTASFLFYHRNVCCQLLFISYFFFIDLQLYLFFGQLSTIMETFNRKLNETENSVWIIMRVILLPLTISLQNIVNGKKGEQESEKNPYRKRNISL